MRKLVTTLFLIHSRLCLVRGDEQTESIFFSKDEATVTYTQSTKIDTNSIFTDKEAGLTDEGTGNDIVDSGGSYSYSTYQSQAGSSNGHRGPIVQGTMSESYYKPSYYSGYAQTLNYAYMTYASYDMVKPTESQYQEGNPSDYGQDLRCGECIRSGYIYCTAGSVYG